MVSCLFILPSMTSSKDDCTRGSTFRDRRISILKKKSFLRYPIKSRVFTHGVPYTPACNPQSSAIAKRMFGELSLASAGKKKQSDDRTQRSIVILTFIISCRMNCWKSGKFYFELSMAKRDPKWKWKLKTSNRCRDREVSSFSAVSGSGKTVWLTVPPR